MLHKAFRSRWRRAGRANARLFPLLPILYAVLPHALPPSPPLPPTHPLTHLPNHSPSLTHYRRSYLVAAADALLART